MHHWPQHNDSPNECTVTKAHDTPNRSFPLSPALDTGKPLEPVAVGSQFSAVSFLLPQPKDQGLTTPVPFVTSYQTYSRLEGAIWRKRLWWASGVKMVSKTLLYLRLVSSHAQSVRASWTLAVVFAACSSTASWPRHGWRDSRPSSALVLWYGSGCGWYVEGNSELVRNASIILFTDTTLSII